MKVRVLIVDDSAFIRKAVRRMLGADPDIEVIGEAVDGDDALVQVRLLAPDVVTLDLRMPRLDGIATLQRMMREMPTPTVLLSSLAQTDGSATLEALAAGAVDFVDKSAASRMDVYDLGSELRAKVKAAAVARVERPGHGVTPPAYPSGSARAVAIGGSTGGPRAIAELVAELPAAFPAPLLVVQHMPAGFTTAFARRLDARCALEVAEARDGDALTAGRVLVAPGRSRVEVRGRGDAAVVSVTEAPDLGHAPSVDAVASSLAASFDDGACLVVLTGMGTDGVAGAASIRRAGGTVIAEHRSTCTVYGMPRAVVDAGFASHVAPLPQIPTLLTRLAAPRPRPRSRTAR